jgi:hypothetical protein
VEEWSNLEVLLKELRHLGGGSIGLLYSEQPRVVGRYVDA